MNRRRIDNIDEIYGVVLKELSTLSEQKYQQLDKDGLVFEIEGLIFEIELAMTDNENKQRRKSIINTIQNLINGTYANNIEKTLAEMFPKTTQLIVELLDQIQIINDLYGEHK